MRTKNEILTDFSKSKFNTTERQLNIEVQIDIRDALEDIARSLRNKNTNGTN